MRKFYKIIALLLVLALALPLAACKKNEEQAEDPTLEGIQDRSEIYSKGIDENGRWEGIKALDFVTLGQYKDMVLPAPDEAENEAQLEMQISNMLSDYGQSVQIKDRAAEKYDTVNIDYAGYMDGEQFEGGTAQGQSLTLGTGQFIPGFAETVEGHMPGDTFNIDLNFPDPYHSADLAGKPVTFTVTLNYIEEYEYPELTDAFVKEKFFDIRGWESVEQMRSEILEDITKRADYDNIAAEVDSWAISEIPESMIDYQKNSILSYYQDYADMNGMELDDFIAATGEASDSDELLELYAPDIERSAKYYLVLQAVAEKAGISVSEEEIKAYFLENTGSEDYSAHVKHFGMPYVKCMILGNIVMDYIRDNAKFE